MQTALDRLSTDDLQSFYALAANLPKDQRADSANDHDLTTATAILIANFFRCGPHDIAIFPIATRINHSCRPNCRAKYDAVSGTMRVHALIDVDAGVELEHIYMQGLLPCRDRQKVLANMFGFVCRCVVCRSESSALARSDRRRAVVQCLRSKERLSTAKKVSSLCCNYEP